MKFDGIEIEEYELNRYKSAIFMKNIAIIKIVVSNQFPFNKQDFKNFIGYKDKKYIRPLCIFFHEKSIYNRHSDKTNCIYFMKKDGIIFDKYITAW